MDIAKLKGSLDLATMRFNSNPDETNAAILEQAQNEYDYAFDPEKKTEDEETEESSTIQSLLSLLKTGPNLESGQMLNLKEAIKTGLVQPIMDQYFSPQIPYQETLQAETSGTKSQDQETETLETKSQDQETETSETKSQDQETETSETKSQDQETESSETKSQDQETVVPEIKVPVTNNPLKKTATKPAATKKAEA